MKKYRILLTIMIAGFVGILLFFIGIMLIMDSCSTDIEESYKSSSPAKSEKIKIQNVQRGKDYITGTIKNTTKNEIEYIQLGLSLYDSKIRKIGNDIANTDSLLPGETWKFKFFTDYLNFKSFKIKIEEVDYGL